MPSDHQPGWASKPAGEAQLAGPAPPKRTAGCSTRVLQAILEATGGRSGVNPRIWPSQGNCPCKTLGGHLPSAAHAFGSPNAPGSAPGAERTRAPGAGRKFDPGAPASRHGPRVTRGDVSATPQGTSPRHNARRPSGMVLVIHPRRRLSPNASLSLGICMAYCAASNFERLWAAQEAGSNDVGVAGAFLSADRLDASSYLAS